MSTNTLLPLLHFNDVYRVHQTSKQGVISADQYAAKIAQIRTGWGEESRALAFLRRHDEEGEGDGGQTPAPTDDDLRGLTLFSGDVFNPSIESSVTRGEHMIEVMNAMSIDCACLGNHDFDFGYPHLQKLMQQTNFPWTFTNIADVGHTDAERGHEEDPQPNDRQVEGTLRSWVRQVHGIRIGCIGLVERDWIATVPSFPPNFRYRSMVQVAKMLSKELRDPSGKHRCDIVIALTHCRLPNDIDLANALGATRDAPENEHGVDLVLGGHDHTYYVGKGIDEYVGEDWQTSLPGKEKDTACMVMKSGTDFHDLSEIELQISQPKDGVVRRRRIVSAKVKRHKTLPTDKTLPELKAHIDELMSRVDQATGQPVAFALTPLDCRMDKVRTEEAGVGNFVADILLHSYEEALHERDRRGEFVERRGDEEREVDMALICGGSLRGDSVFGPGLVALRDILTIMPFEDAVIVRQLKGKDILAALENGFGAYPSQEGRFPQVAGISVVWDSSKPSGSRVVEVRLLEDVHLFHDDGTRRKDSDEDSGSASPAEGAETYAFERKEEGGYSIEVNKPPLRKGRLLERDRVYRVVTREYMASGHDGYVALNRPCGDDLIDHENGALMSTQVRKFLLGASLIWRLKAFRESSNAEGQGVLGTMNTLSSKTRKAIERVHALSEGRSTGRTSHLPTKASDIATAATESGTGGATLRTPRNSGCRMLVDSSPGAFRDAMHVGASEHHSDYDAASKHFRDSRLSPNSAAAGYASGMGDRSIDSLLSNDDGYVKLASTPAQIGGDREHDNTGVRPSSAFSATTASTMPGSNDDVLMTSSSYFSSPKAVRRHVEVSAEDGALLRSAEASLAIIAPMRDGRIVDRARGR